MDKSNVGLSPSDEGQREAFLNELSQFLSDKGRNLCRTPNLAGRSIDLHDLYNRVTSAGGYLKATTKGYWEEFLDVYGYPGVSATLAYGLQKIYQLYLEDYERVHYFGDDEPQPFYRSYPGGYRRYRYAISDMQRIQANMNMLKPAVSNYDRVVLSLESCLPNEVDFAVNACTLLSGESRHVLRLPQCRRIIDALLMHAGIVSEGLDTYSEVLEELQNKTTHNYRHFWRNSIAKKSVLPILLPSKKSAHSNNMDSTSKSGSRESPTSGINVQESGEQPEFVDALQRRLHDIQKNDNGEDIVELDDLTTKRSKWSELFHGHRSLGVEDYEGQRVLQIALVLLNLSFEDFNVTLLARHPSLIRFVFLCIHSEYSCLRQTGLDILSNISSHMQLLHLQFDVMTMIFDTINVAVLSHDKFERIRGFEVLGNICRTRPNVDHVCVSVTDEVYNAAVENLMINDVEILLAAIEALYRLSKLGETTCTKIIFIKGCIDILMCLMTVNVRMFGPEKLAEIRLARKIVPGHQEQQQQQIQPQHHHQPQPYHVPQPSQAQQLHHQNATLMQRQIHLQQHVKIGSAHQAQPTYATAAPSPGNPAQVPLPAAPQAKPPIPPVKIQPQIDPVPTSTPVPVKPAPKVTPSQQAPDVQSSPVISSPPPPVTTTSVPSSSPPGVGPTYTHSETGTVPPVFHYMPAPPLDIVQDNTAESFTKLWIWATYEAQPESYIPRVDVYCEYLASSNRYGRQGNTEILSATDFGKCLKQIFPQATSRLFNQGRGQPQYHIAGIKKRATPLPVPGYQLKDSTSVFSSELEYEKIPVTKPATTPAKTPPTTTVASVPSTQTPAVAPQSASVPIQQLQFQPVLIVSAMPGMNNVTLVPGAQLTAPISEAMTAGAISQAAVAIQSVMVPAQASTSTTVPVALANNTVAAGSQVVTGQTVDAQTMVHGTEAQENRTQVVAPNNDPLASESQPSTTSSNDNESTGSQSLQPSSCEKMSSEVQSVPPTQAPGGEPAVPVCQGVAPSTTVVTSTEAVAPLAATNLHNTEVPLPTDENDSAAKNFPECKETGTEHVSESESLVNKVAKSELKPDHSVENGVEDCNSEMEVQIQNHVPVTNGFMETDSKDESDCNIVANESKNNDEAMETDESLTEKISSKKRSKSKDCEPLVNGFDENSQHEEMSEAPPEPVPIKTNGINGPNLDNIATNSRDGMNGETEAAVNSILDPSDSNMDDILKIDVPEAMNMSSSNKSEAFENSSPVANPVSSSNTAATESSSEAVVSSHGAVNMPENQPHTAVPTSVVTETYSTPSIDAVIPTTAAQIASVENPVATPCVAVTPTNQTWAPGSQATVPVTPTNPIPHSALNQRLKDTITRRKNSQLAPTTTPPANSLPPSVIQQYSYKQDGLMQQIIPITPQQLQHQYQTQRQTVTSNHLNPGYQTTPQVGLKRPLPPTAAVAGPAAKVLRPTQPQFTPSTYPSQYHQQGQVLPQRHPVPNIVHRPPLHPQIQQQHHMPPRPNTPNANPHHQAGQPKPKPPTIDLMAPNASLLVLYRNVGKIPFANHMDEKEDAISKSVRLTASLILTNIARHSNLGRSLLQKHEVHLANVAMSQMDCSPIVARLLSELDM